MKLLRFVLICTIASSALLAACAGEDGDPGVAGTQGEQGDKGDAGADGENGVGYDESTQLGNIVVTFKGTRPDDEPFEKTFDFKFSPTGPDAADYALTVPFDNEGSTGRYFYLQRYSSVVIVDFADYGTNNYVYFDFNKYDEDESYIVFYASVGFVSDDMKFFRISDNFADDFSNVATDYSFNSVTGELKFKYHAMMPADDNDTGHDLDVTADVNVKVLERAQLPG
jgi:hypothetical protein